MKVKELVAELLKCDQELEVCFSYPDYYDSPTLGSEIIINNVSGLDIVQLGVNPQYHGIKNIEHGETYASIW